MPIQDNINKLLWNKRLVLIPEDVEAPEGLAYVLLKDLTLDDRNHYSIIKTLEEAKARKEGVPTEAELLHAARQGNYWGTFEEEIEAKADEHIAFLESEFEAKKKFKSRQNIIKLQIEDAQAKKEAVQRKRNEFRYNSAEYLAHQIASFSLLSRIVLHPDGSQLLADEAVFLLFKREYLGLLYFLVGQMVNENVFDEDAYREIARSGEWRLIWCLGRENLPSIFNRSAGDLNLSQKMLIYWSRVYDSAFESANPPGKEIIDDNKLFDQWLAERDLQQAKTDKNEKPSNEQGHVLDGEYVDTCNCGSKAYNKGKGLGERRMHDVRCPYGTWHAFTHDEKEAKAKLVYGRNSNVVREHIDREHEKIVSKGMVEEQHLRGKKSRQLLGMQSKIIPVRRR